MIPTGTLRRTLCSRFATGVRFTGAPLQRARSSATDASGPSDGLRIQVEQPARRVVGLLQNLVLAAAVERPELLRRVEGRRVQRLPAAELGHLLLDAAVVVAVALPGRQRCRRPEADVDV